MNVDEAYALCDEVNAAHPAWKMNVELDENADAAAPYFIVGMDGQRFIVINNREHWIEMESRRVRSE